MPVQMQGRHYRGPVPAAPPVPTLDAPPRPIETTETETVPIKGTGTEGGEGKVETAYREWRAGLTTMVPTEVESWLYKAFVGGYSAASVRPIVQETLSGTKISRTITAALKLFRDQVITSGYGAEEVKTGEWCSLKEIDQLIAEWEGQEG